MDYVVAETVTRIELYFVQRQSAADVLRNMHKLSA